MTAIPDVEVTTALAPAHRRRRWMWWLLVPAALAVIAAIALAARPSHATTYETALVRQGDLALTVTATGTLDGIGTVDVGAEVSGRLASIEVDEGKDVHAGQILAHIDPTQLQAAVDQSIAQVDAAEAAVAQAQAQADAAADQAARAEAQSELHLIAPQDLVRLQTAARGAAAAVRSAKANAVLARASLSEARTRLGKAVIVAPIDGVVLAKVVEVGQTVTAGFTTPVLFRLTGDLAKMQLLVDIDEADVGRVAVGQQATFTVDAFPGVTFPSSVAKLSSNPQTVQGVVSYKATLDFDNPERKLKPGMTATATITTATHHDVRLVPTAALRFVPEGAAPAKTPRVWVLDGGKPREVAIVPASADDVSTEVDGVDVGAAVITGEGK